MLPQETLRYGALNRLEQPSFKQLILVKDLYSSPVYVWLDSRPDLSAPPPSLKFAPPTLLCIFMEDYDVDMDEEEEGDVFTRKATTCHWWEDAQHQGGRLGCMVNSHSWAEELKDIFAPQADHCYSVARTRLSSISVSDSLCLLFDPHMEINEDTYSDGYVSCSC